MEDCKKEEQFDKKNIELLKKHYSKVLELIGEDPSREGLTKTPERVAKAMSFLTQGYEMNATEILESAMFSENYSQMVLVKEIEFYSLCEHHLIPFFGKANIAYIPDGKIVGLSKLPRVAVVMDARHLCMQMRGVEKQSSLTTTSAFSGVFLESEKTRLEFMNLIR